METSVDFSMQGFVFLAFILSIPFIILFFTIKKLIVKKKEGQTEVFVWGIISLAVILITSATYITNFGWQRLGLFPVYILQVFIVYFIPTITAKHKNTKVFIIPNIVLYISFFITYLILPDVADDGSPYALFMTVQGEAITNTFDDIAKVGGLVFTVAVIVLIVLYNIINKSKSKDSK